MKKPIVISAIILGGIFLIVAIIGAINTFTLSSESEDMIYTTESEVKDIVISTSSENITIYEATDNKVTIKYSKSERHDYNIECINGLLTLKRKIKLLIFNFNFNAPGIQIFVPSKDLNNLTIKHSSGDINLDLNNKIENVEVKCSSGNVYVKNIEVKDGVFKTSSGKIELSYVKADDVYAQTSSGSITVKNSNISELETIISSGNITLDDITTQNAKCNASSGNIKVILKKELIEECKFDASCSSGDISIESETYNVTSSNDLEIGNGSVLFKLVVSSGNIYIKEK